MNRGDVMKIKVNCEEHAVAIVKAFINIGITDYGYSDIVLFLDSTHLFYNSIGRGRISKMSGTDLYNNNRYFIRHHGKEVTLKDIIELKLEMNGKGN